MKPETKRIIAELDKLVGNHIKARAGWECEKCHKRYIPFQARGLTSAHILPKGHYKRMRFEPENLMALCWLPCHDSFWHKRVNEAHEWLERTYPGRYERLQIAARCAPKVDHKLLLAVWRKEVIL